LSGKRENLRGESSSAGLQHAAFRVGEAAVVQTPQRVEVFLRAIEARLDLGGGLPQGRGSLIDGRGLAGAGIAEKSFPSRVVGRGTVRAQKGFRLPRAKPVAVNDVGK